MGSRDIKGNFLAIRELSGKVTSADMPDMPDNEREIVKTIVEASLTLLEGLLLDINRIADAAEANANRD